jgi:hypothetical protein
VCLCVVVFIIIVFMVFIIILFLILLSCSVCCVVKGGEFLLCIHNIHIDRTPMLPLPLCECADSISHCSLTMHVQCLVKPFV